MQCEVCDYNSNKKYEKWKQNETKKKAAQKTREPKTETTYRYFTMN